MSTDAEASGAAEAAVRDGGRACAPLEAPRRVLTRSHRFGSRVRRIEPSWTSLELLRVRLEPDDSSDLGVICIISGV